MSKKVDDDSPPVKLWHFTLGERRISVDAGHLVFVTAIVAWVLWYLIDTREASLAIQNLGLVQPVAILLFMVWAAIAWQTVSIDAPSAPEREAERRKLPVVVAQRIFGSMALLAIYVIMASFIGFDVATALYVAAALYLLGERNPITLVALPIGFCAIAIYLFNTILSTPLPIFFGSLLSGTHHD